MKVVAAIFLISAIAFPVEMQHRTETWVHKVGAIAELGRAIAGTLPSQVDPQTGRDATDVADVFQRLSTALNVYEGNPLVGNLPQIQIEEQRLDLAVTFLVDESKDNASVNQDVVGLLDQMVDQAVMLLDAAHPIVPQPDWVNVRIRRATGWDAKQFRVSYNELCDRDQSFRRLP